MKRIYIILCIVLFFGGRSHAAEAFFTAFEPEKKDSQTSLFSEKATTIDKATPMDEDLFKGKDFFDDDKKIITNENDRKLYAPPPGEDGTPQKIIAPLGNGEMLFFLMLSVLLVGYYFFFGRKELRTIR